MCGLTFLYDQGAGQPELETSTRRALASLAHRGPDEQGITLLPGAAIGHQRLSIIDLGGSHQPMQDETGRYTLAYNGEIYNYREQRDRLAERWRFRTRGDTETLLAGLVLEGTPFLESLNGMWAFALWDRKENLLLLCRDRMGKKPLFYRARGSRMACASELPALLALDAPPPVEDPDSTADYFRYGYFLPGTTAYEGVREVPPGCVVDWRPQQPPVCSTYWQLAVGGFPGTRIEAADRLAESFTRAVERRLVADVEVGAFLSGGVDSSLVVAMMAKRLGISPKTFTIGFREASYDERRFAQQVAEHCGTEHYAEVLDGWSAEDLQRLVLDHVGQPFTDSSLLPTALVSRVAARRVKVALSGDGGDELFCGYQRYQARAILMWYTRLPRGLRSGVENGIRGIPEPMAHHSRSLIKKAHLFVDVAQRIEGETPYIAPLMYTGDQFERLLPDLCRRGHTPPMIPEATEPDELQRMMAADALIYLPQDILTKVDRASMAHSLETRAPFLDTEVVQLAFSLPRRWHRRGFAGKRMLKEAFSNLLPDTIWKRRKQGFGVPIHQWFRGALGTELEQRIEDTVTPLDRRFVRALLEAHRSRSRDHGYRLWQILVYLMWRERQAGH